MQIIQRISSKDLETHSKHKRSFHYKEFHGKISKMHWTDIIVSDKSLGISGRVTDWEHFTFFESFPKHITEKGEHSRTKRQTWNCIFFNKLIIIEPDNFTMQTSYYTASLNETLQHPNHRLNVFWRKSRNKLISISVF